MKHKTYDGALAALCIFLFLTVGCGVAALCLMNNATSLLGFPLKYVLAVLCGAFLAVYLTVLFVCLGKKHGKHMFGLSVMVVLAATVLISLSPVALIVWILQLIIESIAEKRSRTLESNDNG